MAGNDLSAPRHVRARWYLLAEKQGKPVSEVCQIFGISRKTYYKWYRRDHPVGKTGRPPRKMHPHTKIYGQIQVVIVDLKTKYNYGPKKMSIISNRYWCRDISPSCIYKFYKRKKLVRKPQKQLKWYQPMKEPYVASLPGENVQVDTKYVPSKDATWTYQYRFICTVTNLQFAVTLDHKDALSTRIAFLKAQKFFTLHITGIQTDNGSEFRGTFHQFLVRRQIPHRFIPKRSAPWNGKVERANRSVDDEYYQNPTRPFKTLHQYTLWYNTKRPHLGKHMNGLTPMQKYQSLIHNPQKCNP